MPICSNTDDCWIITAPSSYEVRAYTTAFVLETGLFSCPDHVKVYCGESSEYFALLLPKRYGFIQDKTPADVESMHKIRPPQNSKIRFSSICKCDTRFYTTHVCLENIATFVTTRRPRTCTCSCNTIIANVCSSIEFLMILFNSTYTYNY